MTALQITLSLFALILFTGFSLFALISLKEKHRRAGSLSALLALITIALFIPPLFAPQIVQMFILGLLIIGTLTLIVLILWPAERDYAPSPAPGKRVDERTIMFARARLQPDTPQYETYYQAHPEHKAPDDAFRQNPGLLQPASLFYDPVLASSPEGGFFLTESLREAVDGPVASRQVVLTSEKMTRFVKDLAAYHGAVNTGVCALQPYHVYSHIGRGTGGYGAPISLDHRYAIAFTVEMAHEMINSAPRIPAVMESARQYAETGKIAVILAAAIRNLGYPARAHIDGNYRVIAPLVAKDAGLGEIGRMGLLMTPGLGPRVRLAVVTTDLPLLADQATWDSSIIDFCTICKKCAAVCPSQAISFGDRQEHEDGTLRWKIDPERCFTYWTKAGTDCGRCMAVCPYAHANNFFHNLIRFGVAHSGHFRRGAAALDDFFYGKKPMPHSPPDWVKDGSN